MAHGEVVKPTAAALSTWSPQVGPSGELREFEQRRRQHAVAGGRGVVLTVLRPRHERFVIVRGEEESAPGLIRESRQDVLAQLDRLRQPAFLA